MKTKHHSTNKTLNWIKKQLRRLGILPSISEKRPSMYYRTVVGYIRSYFDGYFFGEQDDSFIWSLSKVKTYQLGITKIKVNNKKSKVIITITLVRPGLIIGVKGSEIDNLIKKLSEWLNKPVEIKIIESRLWG